MAELVGAFAASHAPLIARDWHLFPEDLKARFTSGFQALGRSLKAARPDVVIVVAPDHWNNFFLDNLPSICIGVGASNDGPPELFMRDFPLKELPGHAGLGMHLLESALARGFEPSLSHRLVLDH